MKLHLKLPYFRNIPDHENGQFYSFLFAGCLAFILCCIIVLNIYIHYAKDTVNLAIKNSYSIRDTLFNEMVDRAIAKAVNDEERCICIAAHIARNVTNLQNIKDAGDRSKRSLDFQDMDLSKSQRDHYRVLGYWESRYGVCSERSHIMVDALKRLNIRAKIWNIYDYGFGHTCVQAYYDSAWHFFDPTYGGYFTGDDGHVLSWKEIMESVQKGILPRMVVFTPTLDANNNGTRVDNHVRMKGVYELKRLKSIQNAGERKGKIHRIPLHLDLSKMRDNQLMIGKKDASSADMISGETRLAIGSYYFDALGNWHDNFVFELNLENMSDTKELKLRFVFTDGGGGKAHLKATSQTGRVLEGAVSPECSKAKKWIIRYQPEKTDGNVLEIGLDDYSLRSCCRIDCLSIEKSL